MEDPRYAELVEKRDSVGLTHDEANELGRLMAERDDRPYSNADARPDAEPARADAPDAAASGASEIRPTSGEAGPAH